MPAKDESASDLQQTSRPTISGMAVRRTFGRRGRRGRVAAEAAAQAAQDAADAALATAEAAKAALASMALAETSASKTAAAAKIVVMSTRADLADAETEVSMSEVGEAQAHDDYRAAEGQSSRRAKA